MSRSAGSVPLPRLCSRSSAARGARAGLLGGDCPAHIEAFKVEGPLKKDIDVGTAGFPTAGGTIPVVGGTGAFAGARGMVAFAAGTVADQDGFVLSIDITTG